jgi:HEPN domain-containing protein
LPRKTDSNNPADWLYFAESDLTSVQALVPLRVSALVCQSKLAEALEKALKAELVRLGWKLVKTHDLQRLAEELRLLGSDIHSDCHVLCATLAETYFRDRYPGFDLEDPDWDQIAEEMKKIEAILLKVKARLPAASTS